MKNIKKLFSHVQYKEKIYNITYLRLISFEIYKLFTLYFLMSIISRLSYHFPFSLFYEIEYSSSKITKIFIYLLIIDIGYFISFKSYEGHFSILEILINLILKPNLLKILPISFSFCLLYLITKEIKFLMPRLESQYIKNKYNIEPVYKDEYEENYYARKGLSKYTIYESSDGLFIICVSIILLIHFLIIKQKYDLWPKLELGRINNFKKLIWIAIKNILIIGFPTFLIIYFIFIFYYQSLFIISLCLNYTAVFVIEYNILFISIECLHNFICPKINYITNEINSKSQLIKKEIHFEKEECFYIIHHLKNINDIYTFPHDIKLNTELLSYDNLNNIKNKIYFFINSLNRKYSIFLGKISGAIYINNNMNSFDKLRIIFHKILEYFDFSGTQIFENDTCLEIIKLIIELNGNLIIFISDAKINIHNEEKYMNYSDHIYFFIERLCEMKQIFFNLWNNRKISEKVKKDLYKLNDLINNYFNLIRNRQSRNQFIKLETQKIKEILGN